MGGISVSDTAPVWPAAGLVARAVEVCGSRVAYVEGGSGPTVAFVHGNPTSSFLWRKVLARMTAVAHCVAVDLIGMGRSQKPTLDYGWDDQFRHLEGFLDTLGSGGVTYVGHDWGGVLGLEMLRRRPDLVGGLAVLECHLNDYPSWQAMAGRALFEPIRTTAEGRRGVLDDNLMIEQVLPAGMDHHLSDAEWGVYREPFTTPASRAPILRWVEQIPVAGDPPQVTRAVRRNMDTLTRGTIPRLLMYGEPGSVVTVAAAARIRAGAHDGLTVTAIGPGTHFLPEDRPAEIATALRHWMGLPHP